MCGVSRFKEPLGGLFVNYVAQMEGWKEEIRLCVTKCDRGGEWVGNDVA
jgi:hypothetical protein